jgi:hypothetical protein
MKKDLHISTAFDQPDLLEGLVEKLACRRYDLGYGKERVPLQFEALETASAETYVTGNVSISCEGETINMPFITSFLFTCVKAKEDPYKLTWAASLS